MQKNKKVICPDCGAEMNFHAEKIAYATDDVDDRAVDSDFGGILEEAHTCPECGKTQVRQAIN